MRKVLPIFGFLIFVIVAYFGYMLLVTGKLNGTQFVTLLVSFAVISLVLLFASDVQEFSIAGNIVKLKEVKSEAIKSIADLKRARKDNYRFLLKIVLRVPGGFGSSSKPLDSRLVDFWDLYHQIEDFGATKELANEIFNVVENLIWSQLYVMANISDNLNKFSPKTTELPEPKIVAIAALDNDSIQKSANRGVSGGNVEEIKKNIAIGLEEYRRLHELYSEIKNITRASIRQINR